MDKEYITFLETELEDKRKEVETLHIWHRQIYDWCLTLSNQVKQYEQTNETK